MLVNALRSAGFAALPTGIAAEKLGLLRERLFTAGEPGRRCLLDEPLVQDITRELREILATRRLLERKAVAIQAIAFDKTPDANWKVSWHQDVMFPFARPVTQPGFDLAAKKDGIDYARPPRAVLEELLAVRLHVDDCDAGNGPLRVAPGSHLLGVLRSAEIAEQAARHGEAACLARTGDALLMKPLLLHASSPAREPRHRRVLHLVYHCGNPLVERWHRAF